MGDVDGGAGGKPPRPADTLWSRCFLFPRGSPSCFLGLAALGGGGGGGEADSGQRGQARVWGDLRDTAQLPSTDLRPASFLQGLDLASGFLPHEFIHKA